MTIKKTTKRAEHRLGNFSNVRQWLLCIVSIINLVNILKTVTFHQRNPQAPPPHYYQHNTSSTRDST